MSADFGQLNQFRYVVNGSAWNRPPPRIPIYFLSSSGYKRGVSDAVYARFSRIKGRPLTATPGMINREERLRGRGPGRSEFSWSLGVGIWDFAAVLP